MLHTSQKLNACCVSHAGDMCVKRTILKEKMQVQANVMGLHACVCVCVRRVLGTLCL